MDTELSSFEADDEGPAGEDSVRTEERPSKRSQALNRRMRLSEYNSRDMKGKSLLKTQENGR